MLLADLLLGLSAAAIGVFAGAMLTEGAVLVTYWRSLAADAFFAWYAANDRRLLGFFGPLTAVAGLSAIAACAAAFAFSHPGRWPALLAALLMVVGAALFPLYFRAANARFSAASVPADQLAAELARWSAWHWLRVGLSLAALVAALLAR